MDVLAKESDRQEVQSFVRQGIIKLLGFEPSLFCVSSKITLQQKMLSRLPSEALSKEEKQVAEQKKGDVQTGKDWNDLEQYIFHQLNNTERLKLKLENPLGIADKLTNKYYREIEKDLEILKEDKKTVDIIENQLEIFRDEMTKDFKLHLTKIDNVFHELTQRGDNFFEDFLTLSNMATLMKQQKVEEAFNAHVISNIVTEIESRVSEIIDWIIDRRYKQWKAVTDFVYRRAKVSLSEEKLVGSLQKEFNFNRKVSDNLNNFNHLFFKTNSYRNYY